MQIGLAQPYWLLSHFTAVALSPHYVLGIELQARTLQPHLLNKLLTLNHTVHCSLWPFVANQRLTSLCQLFEIKTPSNSYIESIHQAYNHQYDAPSILVQCLYFFAMTLVVNYKNHFRDENPRHLRHVVAES